LQSLAITREGKPWKIGTGLENTKGRQMELKQDNTPHKTVSSLCVHTHPRTGLLHPDKHRSNTTIGSIFALYQKDALFVMQRERFTIRDITKGKQMVYPTIIINNQSLLLG
jgi:hypothetical protein